jgi:hypothetical protein
MMTDEEMRANAKKKVEESSALMKIKTDAILAIIAAADLRSKTDDPATADQILSNALSALMVNKDVDKITKTELKSFLRDKSYRDTVLQKDMTNPVVKMFFENLEKKENQAHIDELKGYIIDAVKISD